MRTHLRKFAQIGFGFCLMGAALAPAWGRGAEKLPDPAAVMQTLERANLAEMNALRNAPIPLSGGGEVRALSSNWVSAAYFVGAARLARISSDPGAQQFLSQVAGHFNYALRGGDSWERTLDADNQALGDLYEELYARRREPGMLIGVQTRMDAILPALVAEPAPQKNVWWWCDALFMAPPVLARLSALTGDPKYLKAMDVAWWRTYDRLYDPAERLYFRDDRFVPMRSETGKKIFWSRGNGWVMAGTARVLESMPADFPSRDRYIALFKQMAARVVALQQSDGLWRSSLVDPQAFADAETSGTGFFVYALAWGINHRILDRKTYLPAVSKGWAALNAHLLPSGLLGAVQGTGDRPRPTPAEATGLYGQGAFLLAGIEVMNLSKPAIGLPLAEPAKDRDWAGDSVPPPPPAGAAGAPSAALPHMTFALPLPPADQRTAQARVHYAPERYDDILWENDRTAHRIYGPALEAYEPPSGSGVDAWGKRVIYPFMSRQLKTGDQHAFHGEGLDFYDVGQARGMGGLGVWDDNALWVSRNYKTFKILKDGPDEAKFQATYAPWPVGVNRKVWETRIFSLPLGTNFTRMVSTIDSDVKTPLTVGIGISRRATSPKQAAFDWNKETGKLTVWEQTDPDKGTMGLALMVDPAQVVGFVKDAANYLVLVKVEPGAPFVYYAGAAWDKGLDMHSKAEWESYVAAQKPDFDARR